MNFRKLPLFSLLFLLLPSFSFASVQIERFSVGLDGYVRPERWAPAIFHVRNVGSPFRGKIQVIKGQTVYEKSLDLGAGARKRIELLYYHTNAYDSLRYLILDATEQVVQEGRLEPRIVNYRDNLILVISNHEYNHQFINGRENPWGGKTFVVYFKPQDLLTEWMAYATADGIALGSISPGLLQPGQWKAIAQQIASGSVLICSSATDLAVLNDPLFRDNLPQISNDLNQITRGEFLTGYWVAKTTEPFPYFNMPAQTILKRPCDREVVMNTPGISLVTSSPYYKGSITYFGFDYSRLPEELSKISAHVWNRIVFPSTPGGDPALNQRFRQSLEQNPRVQKDLYNIPGLRLPDFKWFALFFFIYICAIGPLQYILLKLFKKSTWLWVSFPVIILAFTAGSFGYSKFRQAGTGKITNVGVIEIFPALQQQTVYQIYGTVMAESGTFDFQTGSESSYLRKTAFQSFNNAPEPFVLSEDLPRRLLGESMKRWTFRAYDAFDSQRISLPIHVEIRVESDTVYGKVTNGTSYDIRESFFLYDSRNAASLGTVEAGSSKSFTVELQSRAYPPFAEKHLRDLLHLYAASYSNPHFFFGMVQDQNGEFVVNGRGRKVESTVYVAVYVDSPDATVVNPWTLTTY
jgi:hypothetical protein